MLTGALPSATAMNVVLDGRNGRAATTLAGLLLSGGRGGGGLLEAVGAAELLAKALDAAGGVDELLLAGEEGVAVAADVDRQLLLRAAGFERVSARAVD